MTEDELPPLTGSPLLDPWRIRVRLQMRGELEPPRPHPPTRSEQMLWEVLENEPPGWRREYATGPYRLDFYCPSARAEVEVDGSSHWGGQSRERDGLRDEWHRLHGITTHRFSADEVERQLPWVLESIRERVQAMSTSAVAASTVTPEPADVATPEAAMSAPAADAAFELPLPLSDEAVAAEAELLVESAGDLLAADMAEAVEEVIAVAEACRTILPAQRQGRSLLDLLDF